MSVCVNFLWYRTVHISWDTVLVRLWSWGRSNWTHGKSYRYLHKRWAYPNFFSSWGKKDVLLSSRSFWTLVLRQRNLTFWFPCPSRHPPRKYLDFISNLPEFYRSCHSTWLQPWSWVFHWESQDNVLFVFLFQSSKYTSDYSWNPILLNTQFLP